MPTTYRPYMPEQGLLLPESLSDWLPEDHLAYFISDAVDALDLEAFHVRYEGDGRRRQPFDPRMMVGDSDWRQISAPLLLRSRWRQSGMIMRSHPRVSRPP